MDRDCSAADIERRLIIAFGEMPDAAIYSPTRNSFRPAAGTRMTGLELIAYSAMVLGRASFERKALLTWARAKSGGPSARSVCIEMGWCLRTFDFARQRAASKIAAEINAQRCAEPV